jgi:hypothetical protein
VNGDRRKRAAADLTELLRESSAKILLIVIDGLGGFADAEHDTELEEAATPNLDRLAAEGIVGLLEPVGPGITPGSGPGHLVLFGYDPVEHLLGRGALAAAGIGVRLEPGDVAARGTYVGSTTSRSTTSSSTACWSCCWLRRSPDVPLDDRPRRAAFGSRRRQRWRRRRPIGEAGGDRCGGRRDPPSARSWSVGDRRQWRPLDADRRQGLGASRPAGACSTLSSISTTR